MNTLTTEGGIALIVGANLNLTCPILIVESDSVAPRPSDGKVIK